MNNHEIDIHTAIMDVITDVWDREKQINEATYEILDLIEADRKKFGRNDNDRGNDNDYCKRRGEPVAKVRDRGFEVVDGKHVPTVLVEFPVDDWESRDRFAAAVDTPQPLSESDIPDEPDLARCAECGAEMIHVRPGKWQHPDCSQSSWSAEPVKVNAIFETRDGVVTGTTDAKVKRVEWQDDGSLTVVIDYWPQPTGLASA